MNKIFGLSAIGASPTQRTPRISLFPGGYDADPNAVLLLKLDEGEGVRAVDYSDYGNQGHIIGATWDTGRYGYGLYFDGINDQVVIPHSPSLNLLSDFSIEAYVMPEYAGTQRIIEKPGSYFLELAEQGQKNRQVRFNAGIWNNGAIKQFSTGWNYVIEEWLHVAFLRNQAGYLLLVVNGVEDAISAFATSPADINENNLLIGCGSGGFFFQGIMDEVRLSNIYRQIPGLDPNRI